MADDGADVLALPQRPDAPAIARRWVAERAAWLPPEPLQDALVLVSELVTNAVRHGRPDITLRLRRDPPGIGVEVHDGGDPLPASPGGAPDPTQPHGRGLLIVAALASAWGMRTEAAPPGKTIWFELHVDPDRDAG